jgi:hypothetical protein
MHVKYYTNDECITKKQMSWATSSSNIRLSPSQRISFHVIKRQTKYLNDFKITNIQAQAFPMDIIKMVFG